MRNKILYLLNKPSRFFLHLLHLFRRRIEKSRQKALQKTILIRSKLIATNEPPYNGKVFLIENGRKHWLPSIIHVEVYGFKYPDDVQWVGGDIVRSYQLAGPAPIPRTKAEYLHVSPLTDTWEIREIMLSQLEGSGIEFGAANNPLPVPLHVSCEYADIVTDTNSIYTNYFGKDSEFVPIRYKTSLDSMEGILDSSLDFIIAGHVIEHLPNPLLVLEKSWQKLKNKGKLVLIIPHRDYTFDKNRELTRLQHLIEDYDKPSKERDILHYLEFFSKAINFIKPIEEIYEVVKDVYENNAYDLHYHTWTEDSFKKMIEYFTNNKFPFEMIWSHDCLVHAEGNEFYIILEKGDLKIKPE